MTNFEPNDADRGGIGDTAGKGLDSQYLVTMDKYNRLQRERDDLQIALVAVAGAASRMHDQRDALLSWLWHTALYGLMLFGVLVLLWYYIIGAIITG